MTSKLSSPIPHMNGSPLSMRRGFAFGEPARIPVSVRRWVLAALLALGAAGCGSSWLKPSSPPAEVAVNGLTTEYQTSPLGIDAAAPRLGWKLTTDRRGAAQTAYQVRVAPSPEQLEEGAVLIWDSGRVESDQSVLQPYGGSPLQSGRRYWWQVRIWDERGEVSAWSAPAFWEMGLLSAADWRAQWIEPAQAADAPRPGPSPLLRKPFHLRGKVRSARAYVTSHGLYEFYLNGRRVGDELLTPGWTSYDKRLPYQTYDVTSLLAAGDNAAGVALGDGWYRGKIGTSRDQYGARLGLLLQIRVQYEDGGEDTIISDGSWKWSGGPIQMSEIYAGETYDARLEQAGWNEPAYDDRQWGSVELGVEPGTAARDILFAAESPPIRRQEELRPVRIFTAPNGDTVADFGQNLVGWVRLRAHGAAGTVVRLRHAEVLDQQGNLYTASLRTAEQEVRYTLSGQGEEVYEPHFTYQGFRYVAIDGYPGALDADSLTGIVIHADMPRSGSFETSDPLLNQLQHNIVWSEKGNFLAVPTDCPQRDERLGWTGDAEVFLPTAALNFEVPRFFGSWLADLAADQWDDGGVPWVVPDVLRAFHGIHAAGAAGWGDAATVIPWDIYQAYGDRDILATQYPSMVRWVEYEQRKAGAGLIWSGGFQFGDWLDLAAEHRDRFGTTSADFVATAYFAHSVDILSRTARVLGRLDEAERYAGLFEDIKAAFQRRFVAADGRIEGGTQTVYVLALDFDLLPDQLRPVAARLLALQLRDAGHLTTGFLGTPHLLNVLSRYGYTEDAYRLLERKDYPSWLYPITRGATTIWEHWDGIKPDGSFQNSQMNSFNHYAYGAVGEWMYRNIAGIQVDPAAPGYKRVLIRPEPGGGLTRASARLDTLYGTVESSWSMEGGRMDLQIRVPPNTTGQLRLPGAVLDEVREGGVPLSGDPGIHSADQQAGDAVLEIGSGVYHFNYPRAVD